MSTALALSIAQLDAVTRGNSWRRVTSPEVAAAVDEVLRTWRAAHR